MRRADRLFDIIQTLRTAKGPVTAEGLAKRLEVTVRTVYRDVATLQARRVPIEGAAGIGYVLRPGFDLPPLMFTADEIEAIAVAMRMLRRTGDDGLQAAAEMVLSKVTVALPDALREHLIEPPFFVSHHGAPLPPVADLAAIRAAIRDERKLRISYGDEKDAAPNAQSGLLQSPISPKRLSSMPGASCATTFAISALTEFWDAKC